MSSNIEERNLRTNVQTNDAPDCTVHDLCVLVEHSILHAEVATGLKSVHDAALLNMMWHTFGRAIDTCFARKQQLSIEASGELFLHIARIKTSVVQGVSVFKSPECWQQCILHAFGMLFVCYDEASEYLFPLLPRYVEPDLPGGQTYTQEEAVVYWEKREDTEETMSTLPQKRQRKRPNVASYITEVMRDTILELPPSTRQSITQNMSSHSLRRGPAAYANASPKLTIQWISTRGAWLLESLTKAFAYIGTTSKEDQSVGKVLAGYEAPDLPVVTPSIFDLQDRLPVAEYGQLLTLRDELFRNVLGSPDARYNVVSDVVNATFAALLIHLKEVLDATRSSTSAQARVSKYVYELGRGIEATNTRLGSSVSIAKCCEWGEHLKARWRTANHAQMGRAVAGNEKQLASILESMLGQLSSINDRLARLEDLQMAPNAGGGPRVSTHADELRSASVVAPLNTVPAQATATTLVGCLLNWYVNHIWETVKGKQEQNKRAEAKAAVNIMVVLYQDAFKVPAELSKVDAAAYQNWKHFVWELALKMDSAANQRLQSFDHKKKPTGKASSLRKRWRQLKTSHSDAYRSLGAQYLALISSGSVIDLCTPQSHFWSASDLV